MLSPSRSRARESARYREGDFVHGRRSRCELAGRADRPNAGQRGYGAAWRRIRAGILERDPGTCTSCSGPATQVDHLIPKYSGLRASVCRLCHDRKTGREGQAARRPRSGLQPSARRPIRCPSVIIVISGSIADSASTVEGKSSRRAESAPRRRGKAPLVVQTSHFRNNPAFSIASLPSLPTI
jgi:5-methylcytosine-specific restriction enzyme A